MSTHEQAARIATDVATLNGRAGSRPGRRKITLPLAPTEMEPVRWLWEGRVPAGALSLLGGREGLGKSILAYTLAAKITRGTLEGQWYGTPRSVVVCATEDSWKHTITPRLFGAGADMSRVHTVAVEQSDGANGSLTLPQDLHTLGEALHGTDVVLVILDPLISRLDGALDSHKDSEVRQALEPLAALADRHGVAFLGLIHVNKARTDDPLSSIMASRAFPAVARSVQYVLTDPADETARLFGTPKNNLGRSDLPSLRFRIEGLRVGESRDGRPVYAGVLRWDGEDGRSIHDVMADSQDSAEIRSATTDAAVWLVGYLRDGGTMASADIRRDGQKNGYSYDALKRARKRLGLQVQNVGSYPRTTYWSLPGTQLDTETAQ